MNIPHMVRADRELKIDKWPMGRGGKRGLAHFYVEVKKAGQQRVCRTTLHLGKTSKPKALTYGLLAIILTGDDDRTYPAIHSDISKAWSVYDSGMKTLKEYVTEREYPEVYKHLSSLYFSTVQKG